MRAGMLDAEIITDLLRSAWIVERARAALYEAWSEARGELEAVAGHCRERAEIIQGSLGGRRRPSDERLVEPHTRWIGSVAGAFGEVPLGRVFVARLGDWVTSHASPYADSGGDRLAELGRLEQAKLAFPEDIGSLAEIDELGDDADAQTGPTGTSQWRFGILGDLHIGSRMGETMARAAIADLNRAGVELVIQLGDITDNGEASEFETAAEVLGELEMPWAVVIGNHDARSVSEGRATGRDYFSKWFGRLPEGALLEHRGVSFALLDSADERASPFSDFDLVTGTFKNMPPRAVARGALTYPQHDILADVAAPGGAPAFVFLHHPPQPFTAFPPLLFGLREEDSGRLHAAVDSGNIWGVFAGHTHRNARTRSYGTIAAHEVGAPRDYPCGFALVDVSESGYAYRFVQISNKALLRESHARASELQRRYARGSAEERAFAWTKEDPPTGGEPPGASVVVGE